MGKNKNDNYDKIIIKKTFKLILNWATVFPVDFVLIDIFLGWLPHNSPESPPGDDV